MADVTEEDTRAGMVCRCVDAGRGPAWAEGISYRDVGPGSSNRQDTTL
jgi:hypothetical protein